MKLKENRIIKRYIKHISEINEASSGVKIKSVENSLVHGRKEELFNQEIKLLQKHLKKISADFNKLKETLDREVNSMCFIFIFLILLLLRNKKKNAKILKSNKNLTMTKMS
jgi:hypothetical protein